ncbi:hypothetical protein [Erwinia phage FBB1]|nr:hypothetical protein [Erwinia phage FBB1]
MKSNTWYQFKDEDAKKRFIGMNSNVNGSIAELIRVMEKFQVRPQCSGTPNWVDIIDNDGHLIMVLDSDGDQQDACLCSKEFECFVEVGKVEKSKDFDTAVETVKGVIGSNPAIDAFLKLVRYEMNI